MSGDLVEPVICPKCGQPSRNATMCEACGAIFRRVREREAMLSSCGVSKEEAWHMAADATALEVPASETRGRVMSVAIGVIVVLALAGGATLLMRKGPPKTPSELIERHRAIATEIQEMHNKGSLASGGDHLILIRHEVGEMEKTIEGLPGGPQSAVTYRKRALGEANAMLADAAALSTDDLAKMLAGPDDRNDVARALERLDDAEHPWEAMDRDERRRKDAEAAESREQRRAMREMSVDSGAAMPADIPDAAAGAAMPAGFPGALPTGFPGGLTPGKTLPQQGQPMTPEQQARVEAQLNAMREEALRQQRAAQERTMQAIREAEQGSQPPAPAPEPTPEITIPAESGRSE